MIGLERRRPVPTRVRAAPRFAYRRALVPLLGGAEGELAVDLACRLAADRHAVVVALGTIEISLEMPLDVPAREEERRARELLERALAIGASYGIRVVPRTVRTRSAGDAILEEAVRGRSEVIVLGLARGARDRTSAFVLKHARCRVIVASSPPAAAA